MCESESVDFIYNRKILEKILIPFTIAASENMNSLGINLKGALALHSENYKTLLTAKRPK